MNYNAKQTPNSLNPIKPTTVMKPEGSRKISVLNGSRQIDQVIGGEWTTIKVLPENGLPRGVHQLADAVKAGTDPRQQAFEGQLLHIDSKTVYQFHGKGIVMHDRAVFKELEDKGQQPVVGRVYAVSYESGRGKVVREREAPAQALRSPSVKGKGVGL